MCFGVVEGLLGFRAVLRRTEELLDEEAPVALRLGRYDVWALLDLSMLVLAVNIEDEDGATHVGGCVWSSDVLVFCEVRPAQTEWLSAREKLG